MEKTIEARKCDMKEVEPGSLVGKCEGDLMVYGDNGRNTTRCWRHVRMVEIWIRSCLVNELVLWEFLKAVNDEKLEEQMNLISELRNWVKAK